MIYTAIVLIFLYIMALRMISILIQPMFLVRYLYIVIGLVWFVIAYLVTKIHVFTKYILLPRIVLILTLCFLIPCINEFSEDLVINKKSDRTIEEIESVLREYPEGQINLVSDIDIITSRFYNIYFPEASVEWYGNMNWKNLEEGQNTFAILQKSLSTEEEKYFL